MNVSVEGYVRKEQREEEARRVREGKSCSLQMFGSSLSPRMGKKNKKGSTKTLTKKKRGKKGIWGEIKTKKM